LVETQDEDKYFKNLVLHIGKREPVFWIPSSFKNCFTLHWKHE